MSPQAASGSRRDAAKRPVSGASSAERSGQSASATANAAPPVEDQLSLSAKHKIIMS